MPRRSTAALTTVTPLGSPPRLVPPEGMAEGARQIFLDIVLDNDPTHFRPSDAPLLRRYCEAHAWADRAVAADDSKLFAAMSKTASALALRLRLSPQARQPRMPKPQPLPTSYYDRVRLEQGR